jgi:glycosyltransferase involved in cell wall biosynthesis
MRIVHAAKFYPPVPGGMETVVKDLCDGMADEYDVRVVGANTGRATITECCGKVTVTRVASLGKAHSVPLCPTLPLHLWRAAADCVVLHEPNPLAGTALFAHTPSSHLIVWHHSDLLRPVWAPATYGRLQRALYRRADCVIVSSPPLAEGSGLVRHARRVAVVPFGIRLERFSDLNERQRALADLLRRRYPGPRILFVGRFVYYKGLEVLVDAMVSTPGTLLLAGEGPLEHEIRQRAAARTLSDRTHILGHVGDADLPAYYDAADIVVLPSIAPTETFGVVQLEAMAAGRPVVSTNLPTGVPWVNQHDATGLVVPPGDVPALAAALTRLGLDDHLRRMLGAGGSSRARSTFSIARMVEAFKGVVDDVVTQGADQRAAGPVQAGVP